MYVSYVHGFINAYYLDLPRQSNGGRISRISNPSEKRKSFKKLWPMPLFHPLNHTNNAFNAILSKECR
jgi:hypothetical protein